MKNLEIKKGFGFLRVAILLFIAGIISTAFNKEPLIKEAKAELKEGCVKPARGPIVAAGETATTPKEMATGKAAKIVAKVGQEAIDFEANAFVQGYGFKPIKLSDYKGKWIVLCFYPGDFTFV